jgi:hypothetical protein
VVFEAVEVSRPKLAIRGQPLVQLHERLGADAVEAPLGIGACLDEPGVFENAEVLGDRGLTYAEAVDEVTNRLFAVAEEVEDLQPTRLGEDFKCGELGHALSMTIRLYARQEIEVDVVSLR